MTQTTSPVMTEFEADVIVAGLEPAAEGVVLLTLTPVDGNRVPSWTPGAHVDVILEDAGAPMVRQYSLCGSPGVRDRYQVAVLKSPESRGGSEAVHRLAKGDRVSIRGPRNHFSLQSSSKYIFIAGGIGITPLLPMIEEADAAGAEWVLHYGGRTIESMAFCERLAVYGDRVHLVPQDRVGLLDLPGILGTPSPDTLVYCCGPEPLLNAVEQQCSQWPGGSLHLERFTAKAGEKDGEETSFEVVLQRSALTVEVQPGTTVFDAMRSARVSVLGSCLEGVCGTCEQKVLEGEVDHRDSVLDDDERAANDCMMVCVSRARGDRLVLDA